MNFYHYSNGKILLTAEYLVMHGAKALAIPVNYGQDLNVSNLKEKNRLRWIAYEFSDTWFEATFQLPDLRVIQSTSSATAEYLKNILLNAKLLHGGFLNASGGMLAETKTNFPINWGLGTSSTLINNIAAWAQVDPFKLHNKVSKGSGYDIACAGHNSPIYYQKTSDNERLVKKINLGSTIKEHSYFIYSGKKQATESQLNKINWDTYDYKLAVEEVSAITDKVTKCDNVKDLIQLVYQHEQLMRKVLKKDSVAGQFESFRGAIKSLGAWGGDFFLAVSEMPESYVRQYFEQFGLSVIIPFNQMIKHKK